MKFVACKYSAILIGLFGFNFFLAQEVISPPDTIKRPAERLEDIVDYKAKKQIKNDLKNKLTYLIEKAYVKYKDMTITADYMVIDWNTGEVYSRGTVDSLGNIVGRTIFNQGGKKYESQEFSFNFKTQKGIAYNTRTEENEGVIVAKVTKRANDSTYFMRRGFFTTDEYFMKKLDSLPDYHLSTSRIKYVEKKSIITGPIQMYIEQVPTPLILPFFYMPVTSERSAGILIPSFGEREDVGFFLQGLGFYTPIGEYFDFTTRFDVYTKGSWAVHLNSVYKKRYRFSGNFNFDYENVVRGIQGLPNYTKTALYRIAWNHSQDSKANPNLVFSASVNYTSSQFFVNTINNNNIFNGSVLTNTTSSSISMVKRFENLPFSVSANLNHNQNFSSGKVFFTLPQLTLNLTKRLHPFAPKSGIKKGLFQNINFNYSLNLLNNIETTDTAAFTANMFNDMKTGLRHNVDLATQTNIFTYFNVTMGLNYQDVWTTQTVRENFDSFTNQVVQTKVDEFRTFRTFGYTAGVQTNLYGMLKFKKGKIEAIRHVMMPSVSYSITPDFSRDFWGYFRSYVNGSGQTVRYSIFKNGVFGSPGEGFQSSVNFAINNNLEMKVRSKSDSTSKKVKIFEFLNVNTSYNMAAESFKWSPINITGSTAFLDNKVRMNFGAVVNPYRIEFASPSATTGTLVDDFGHFSLSNYNIALNFGLDNKMFSKEDDLSKKYKRKGTIRNERFYFDKENYAHFAIPWNLQFGVMYNHTQGLLREPVKAASVNVNGSISPAPYWNISFNSSYDITNGELAFTSINFQRDIRSFLINFSWVPFGPFKTWNFFFGIKANILRDAVKYEERNFPAPSNL